MFTTIGFLLALADFTENTHRLERFADLTVETLEVFRSMAIKALFSRNAIIFGMLIGTMPGLGCGMIVAGTITTYFEDNRMGSMPDFQFWPLFLFLFFACTIVCALGFALAALSLLNIPLIIAKLLYWTGRALNYPRKGIIGSIGLAMASIDFLSYWMGRMTG